MARSKTKVVSFYMLRPKRGATVVLHKNVVDWGTLFEQESHKPIREKEFEGHYFDHHVLDGYPMLRVHRPLTSEFMTHIDPDATSLDDVPVDENALKRFAQSSAYCFLLGGQVIAMGKGSQSSPGMNIMSRYLDTIADVGPNTHWMHDRFLMDSDIRELQERAAAARGLKVRFTTERQLFTDTEPTVITDYPDKMADALGWDMQVDLEFKLDPSAGAASKRQLLAMIKEALPRIVGSARNAPEALVEIDGEEKVLSLGQHNLTREVEISPEAIRTGQFATLSAEVLRIAKETESLVRQRLEG